jgi:hypothetical protein
MAYLIRGVLEGQAGPGAASSSHGACPRWRQHDRVQANIAFAALSRTCGYFPPVVGLPACARQFLASAGNTLPNSLARRKSRAVHSGLSGSAAMPAWMRASSASEQTRTLRLALKNCARDDFVGLTLNGRFLVLVSGNRTCVVASQSQARSKSAREAGDGASDWPVQRGHSARNTPANEFAVKTVSNAGRFAPPH